MHRETTPSETFRWWWLPSWLGLDAPVVVSTWTLATAVSTGIVVSPSALAALFFTVWAIYLADRLVDVARCRDWSQVTGRMRFGRRHRKAFAVCVGVALAVDLALLAAGLIPKSVIVRAAWVASGMAVYAILFVVPVVFGRRLPGKEFGVGLFFAGGAFAVIGGEGQIFLPLLGIAVVVAFNCLVISARETESDAVIDPSSAGQWWRTIRRDLVSLGSSATVLSLLWALAVPVFTALFGVTLAMAFAGLVWLHRVAHRMSADTVRAVADFCLLTPWLGVPFWLC